MTLNIKKTAKKKYFLMQNSFTFINEKDNAESNIKRVPKLVFPPANYY